MKSKHKTLTAKRERGSAHEIECAWAESTVIPTSREE
jgi:hypothetical protein